jgi:iron complex outermembrane receptor protein
MPQHTWRAFACACCFTSPALAASPQNQLDAVIVTATRFADDALSAPIGTRVITAEQIADSTATTLPELLGKLSGAHVRNNSGSPNLQIDLRGFGITGDQNTLVLLDGVRLNQIDLSPTRLSAIPLESIERIEILPGGGAVQYGGGATGGTINIISKQPDASAHSASLGVGIGDYDTNRMRGSVSTAGREWGLTLSAEDFKSDNYRDNNAVDQQNVLGNLRWQRADNRLALTFGMDRQSLGLPGYRNALQLKTDRDGTDQPDSHSHLEGEFATLSAHTAVRQWEFEADASYRDGSNRARFIYPLSNSSYYPQSEFTDIGFSPRARWSNDSVLPIRWVIGVDWYDRDWQSESQSFSAFGPFPSAADAEQKSRALYTQLAIDLTPSTRLNLGWRAQRVDTTQRNIPPSAYAKEEESNTLYARELGLRQGLGAGWSAYARLGSSFRIASVEENNAFAFTGTLLKPQTSDEVEGGVEYRNARLRTTLSVYEMRLKNEIAFMPLVPPFGGNSNLSPTRRQGVDLSAAWQALPTLELSGRLSWIDASFRKGSYGGVDVSGNDVPLVPKRLASAQATWQFMAHTKFALSYTYVGEQRYDNDQANRFRHMPTYDLVDMRLSREIGHWLLALNVNNIFDTEYYSYAIVPTVGNGFSAYPQVGRTAFASLEYRFR